MIVPGRGGLEALLAEPAIRALGSGGGEAITVCHEFADLFAGHPAVHALAYTYPEHAEQFERIITLEAGQEKGKTMDRIWDYAGQMGVSLSDERPRLFLNSFDLIRVQRFGLGKVPRPRTAVALPEGMSTAQEAAWRGLCRTLGEKMECGIVLLGREVNERVSFGRDLRGKLMARETAAVLSQCDVLIAGDAEMIWTAAAVKVPGIFVGSAAMASMVCPEARQGVVECAAEPEDVIEAMSRLSRRDAMQEGEPE